MHTQLLQSQRASGTLELFGHTHVIIPDFISRNCIIILATLNANPTPLVEASRLATAFSARTKLKRYDHTAGNEARSVRQNCSRHAHARTKLVQNKQESTAPCHSESLTY